MTAVNPSLAASPRVEDWITVRADGFVEIRTGKLEIGQRISTAIALVAAGELGVPFDRIVMIAPETGVSPDEGYTSGSSSMEQSGHAVRHAAATARRELVARAARRLGVSAASLEAAGGLVRSRATNHSLTFAELTENAPLALDIDPEAPFRPASEFALASGDRSVKTPGDRNVRTLDNRNVETLGDRSVEALGLRELVTGAQRFVHDLVFPEMLHARVVRPPHYHAQLAVLPGEIEARLGGARLIRDGSFLAVAAEDEHDAVRAAAQVAAAAQWTTARGLDERPLAEQLLGNRRESLPVRDCRPREEPVPPEESPPAGTRTLRAVYERPYQMHASLAPSAALAHLGEDHSLTVWTHSQGLYPLRAGIAEALGIDPAKMRVVHAPGSGCYGHNGSDDAALEAVLVARSFPGRPVLLKWSREDEHGWEPYGPGMHMRLLAHIDGEDGRVRYWSHETYSDSHVNRTRPTPGVSQGCKFLAPRHWAGDPAHVPPPKPNLTVNGGIHRNATPPYAFPKIRIVKHLVHELPLRVSSLRTLGAYANVFAAESFMDELAHAAGADPLDYRRRHLEDERTRAVLDAAAERFGWTAWRTVQESERAGRGVAVARYKNMKSYCAVAVEVNVTGDAQVRLARAVVAVDAGQIVDPDGLAAQLEGGFIQAASWTLLEAVTWDRDGITSRDWESYPILRFDNVPEIETVLVDRPGAPFLGAGEAACGPAGAAIANAVFDATGVRARRLPLTPEALREAAAEG